MADNEQIYSLAPLKACTRLLKLDLRGCNCELRDQVADLRLACTQMARHRSRSRVWCTICSPAAHLASRSVRRRS
jgi:hypothetical protein